MGGLVLLSLVGITYSVCTGHLDRQHKRSRRTCDAHAVNDVTGEAEGHDFGRVQKPALLEGDAEVNVHNLRAALVDEYVGAVPIAESYDITCKRTSKTRQ